MKVAPIISLLNAVRLRKKVCSCICRSQVTIAGPGPNSFLFWMSFLTPRKVRFAFFIRGDTLRTVQEVYHGSPLYFGATSLVRLFRARIRRLLKERRALVFVFGDHLRQQYGSFQDSIFCIYPLLDDSFLRKDSRATISNDGPLKLLFVGRLSREKNVSNLVKACSIAKSQGSPFELSIVGSGPLDGAIKEQIESQDIGDKVSLFGHIASSEVMVQLYDSHHVLCLPSHTEGTPRVVVEAFARGMPVLATRVGSLPELFPSNVHFIEGYSARDIFDSVRWANYNRSVISEMGLAGQKEIGRFLISENVLKVERILRNRRNA